MTPLATTLPLSNFFIQHLFWFSSHEKKLQAFTLIQTNWQSSTVSAVNGDAGATSVGTVLGSTLKLLSNLMLGSRHPVPVIDGIV